MGRLFHFLNVTSGHNICDTSNMNDAKYTLIKTQKAGFMKLIPDNIHISAYFAFSFKSYISFVMHFFKDLLCS